MNRKTPRKLDRMHLIFGRHDGHTCGECSNFVSGKYHDKTLRKCRVYGLTHSEASDWKKSGVACGMFNRESKFAPVIEWRNVDVSAPEVQIDGQTEMEGM